MCMCRKICSRFGARPPNTIKAAPTLEDLIVRATISSIIGIIQLARSGCGGAVSPGVPALMTILGQAVPVDLAAMFQNNSFLFISLPNAYRGKIEDAVRFFAYEDSGSL
jgi:hypothetical protein